MWVRQAARLLLTCRRVFCQCQACHQNPRASSAQLVRASLLTSRSGVRASRGTFCLLSLSFGMLCATTQVASMSSMDLHSFWKVYVRTPLGFRLISISSGPSCKGCPEKFHWISVDLCPLWDCIVFLWIRVYSARATPQDFIIFFAIHGASEIWMQHPCIKVAMGLKSNILPLAMRAETQLAARGAHNPQVMDSHISSRRIHDADL